MLMVHKYGGTSLGDSARIRSAARRTAELARQGNQVVLVVSAQAHTTDDLIAAARGCGTPSPREMDAYLAAGEQMSAGLMAMALEELGCPAVSLSGWQAGIHTDGVHGNADILKVDTARIRQELEFGRVVVVAGFQGIGPDGDVTTLGRGGSDTTAVALAAWLEAAQCRIYTDVDGVYDRDPNVFADAAIFRRIGYGQMLELIRAGAQVLHDKSVVLAREKGISLEVLSAFTGAPGTIVGDVS